MTEKIKIIKFEVLIPVKNKQSYIVEIDIPVEERNGLEILTPQAHVLIDWIKLYHITWIRDYK
jgi:hypothetical protein